MKISDPLGKVYTHTMFKKRPVARSSVSEAHKSNHRAQSNKYSRHHSSENDEEEHLERSAAAHLDDDDDDDNEDDETEQSDDSLSTGSPSQGKRNENTGNMANDAHSERFDPRRISSVRNTKPRGVQCRSNLFF